MTVSSFATRDQAEPAAATMQRAAPACAQSILEVIGATPMLALRRLAPELQLFAKLEWLNPGGSIKDRAGFGMIMAAERDGRLRSGMRVIEATAGNTGIGLTLAACQRGYAVRLYMPAGNADEKARLCEALGAEVIRTPKAEGITGAIAAARADTESQGGNAYMPLQWSNADNVRIHELSTAEEIREQLQDRIDAVVIGVGSSGTFTGVCRALKRVNPALYCVAVESQGSVLQGGPVGPHEVEGIGASFVPDLFDRRLADDIMMINDSAAFDMVRRLARQEGVLVGGSAGANAVAALRVAERLGPTASVVTIFPDGAERYLSKGWLRAPNPARD